MQPFAGAVHHHQRPREIEALSRQERNGLLDILLAYLTYLPRGGSTTISRGVVSAILRLFVVHILVKGVLK